MSSFSSGHARRNGGEHEDTFEAFAKYEHANVETSHGSALIWAHWIRGTLLGYSLPNHNGNDNRGCQAQTHGSDR